MRTHLDLCSGIGGFALALQHLVGGFRTIGYVEIERYCREVLRARIRDGMLDDAPIFHDVRDPDLAQYRGKVDCLTAGFPCQPFSVAGKRKGEADERNLWPDIARVIRQVVPATVFLENVPALLAVRGNNGRPYFGTVLGDLAACGYDCRWDCIPASAVGAHFQRDRLWILAGCAVSDSVRPQREWSSSRRAWSEHQFKRLVQHCTEHAIPAGSLGRVSDGVPNRPHRLRALGNSVVPAVVAKAWEVLTETEDR